MNKLTKEFSAMLKELEELYYRTEDEEEKEKLIAHHKNLSEKLEKVTRAQFDRNDKYYQEAIEKLKKTKKEITKHLKTQLQIVELFKYLTDFTEQLDALLFN